jgi:hypothetical protein
MRRIIMEMKRDQERQKNGQCLKKHVCVELQTFKHIIKENCVVDIGISHPFVNFSIVRPLSLELAAPTYFLHYSITFAKMVSVAFGIGILVSSEQKG